MTGTACQANHAEMQGKVRAASLRVGLDLLPDESQNIANECCWSYVARYSVGLIGSAEKRGRGALFLWLPEALRGQASVVRS